MIAAVSLLLLYLSRWSSCTHGSARKLRLVATARRARPRRSACGEVGAGTTAQTDPVMGTVVRFRSGATSVEVTIGEDSPATRDFLSMLPLTISLEEYAGREKISYLPRELNHEGSPGSDPEDGDLIYFTPWGNLGFYYDAAGVGYSDQTLHIGTYAASLEQLNLLQGDDVTVEIVE